MLALIFGEMGLKLQMLNCSSRNMYAKMYHQKVHTPIDALLE